MDPQVVFDAEPSRLLACSDAPYTLPASLGGGRRDCSHPGHVAEVARRMAAIRGMAEGDALAVLRANVRRVFGI